MRYLAIDLGAARTGVAVGDDETGIATPVTVIETRAPEQRLAALTALVHEHAAEALVLGLPLNMDGTLGPAAEKTQAFAETLLEATGLDVYLVDERLSSAAADEAMARTGLTHGQKKARRDALAAAAILRAYFASKR